MEQIAWSAGRWTHDPVSADQVESDSGTHLVVEAVESSDAWRVTSYGFVHDTEHALLVDWPTDTAMEVDFHADFTGQFDQAGIFLRADEEHWVKAGLELSDGVLQLGAVVTWPVSDWSVGQVPDWNHGPVSIRVSRTGDAVTVRARRGAEDWRLVRVIPIPTDARLAAGPFVCAPSRAGLVVRFTDWRQGPADASLH